MATTHSTTCVSSMLNSLKLDGAFVRNNLNSKIDFSLAGKLSRLCQDLGILMLAEFVESRETMEALQKMGVDYAHSYYLGVPTPRMKQLMPSRPATPAVPSNAVHPPRNHAVKLGANVHFIHPLIAAQPLFGS